MTDITYQQVLDAGSDQIIELFGGFDQKHISAVSYMCLNGFCKGLYGAKNVRKTRVLDYRIQAGFQGHLSEDDKNAIGDIYNRSVRLGMLTYKAMEIEMKDSKSVEEAMSTDIKVTDAVKVFAERLGVEEYVNEALQIYFKDEDEIKQ